MLAFNKKIVESLLSVFPVVAIVLAVHFLLVPFRFWDLILYLIGSVLVVFGMAVFTLGADLAMMPMGEYIGSRLTKTKRLWILLPIAFFLGTLVTIAEPDLQVLANQVPSVPSVVIVLTVAVGVGLFLMVALLRILFQLPLSYLLIGLYGFVFLLAAFTPVDYLAVAFDSGGVTTGPVTVPFILALGVGLSAVLGGRSSHDDSFGLVALCSIGPILAVLILGMFYDASSTAHAADPVPVIASYQSLLSHYLAEALHTIIEVALALLPILVLFAIFQITVLHLSKQRILKLSIGMLLTFFGLVCFLTGVKGGFLPVGALMGEHIGSLSYNWILVPLAALMGFFVVAAEPAVHVLNIQVRDITGGAISKRTMMASLSIGVGLALALSMLRILYSFSIWYYLLPGYIIALGLTLVAPKIFTAIAFDSGGVASGPMTATFLLPFAMGATEAVGGNLLIDAFGIVSLVAMTPLITIQFMGVVYRIKLRQTDLEEQDAMRDTAEQGEDMLEWDDDGQ
jgi:hypothetical protein